jgi:hypothetical protein
MIKKSLLLIVIAICALFIDGNLTHDIVDYRLDSFSKWATTILILLIILLISWPQSSKNNKTLNKKN